MTVYQIVSLGVALLFWIAVSLPLIHKIKHGQAWSLGFFHLLFLIGSLLNAIISFVGVK